MSYTAMVAFATRGESTLQQLVKLLLLIFAFPIFLLGIGIDRWFFLTKSRINPFIPFPRSPREIRLSPQLLFDKIVQCKDFFDFSEKGAVRLVFVAAETFAPLTEEPDKNDAVVRVVFKYKATRGTHTDERSLDVFVKTPSVRNFSMPLKALGATFSILPKEVAFYLKAHPELSARSGGMFPLPVPSPLLVLWCRTFDQTLLVTRTVDAVAMYRTIPDWKMVEVGKISHMLRAIAPLHAATWDIQQPSALVSIRQYFPGDTQSTVGWVEGPMQLFFSKRASPPAKMLWTALSKLLRAGGSMVLSHGDYRPGNMMWLDDGDDRRSSGAPAMVATDLELTAVTPYLWDASYAIYVGIPPELRRLHEVELLSVYITSLAEALKQRGQRLSGPLPQAGGPQLMQMHRVLGVVLYYYQWMLAVLSETTDAKVVVQGTSVQGNTKEDEVAWVVRVSGIIDDVFGTREKRVQFATVLDLDAKAEVAMESFAHEAREMLKGCLSV